MQFSVLDPFTSTDKKLTVMVENVLASYDQGQKSSDSNTIDRQMTYYADNGEFVFEFDTSECESYSQTTYTCFTDTAVQNDQFGHWDVLWDDETTSTTDCYPGRSGCSSDADNILDLTQDGGGVFEISKNFGAGSSISLVFDESANTWAVAGIGASNGIDNRLESSTPDVNFEANAPWRIYRNCIRISYRRKLRCISSFHCTTGGRRQMVFTCGSGTKHHLEVDQAEVTSYSGFGN